jgi:hypothetical protein
MKKIRRVYWHLQDFYNLGDILICAGITAIILSVVVWYGTARR